MEFSSSANNVTRQEGNNNSPSPRRNYNSNGHSNYNHRGNSRGGSYRGRGRGRGRGNGGPRCQVCGIPGHTALTCRNHFNHSYQVEDYRGANSVTSAGYHPEPNWFIDCGATDHLTSELDRLTVQERYHGKDQVQVANGAGLSISHVGQSIIPGLTRPLYLKNVLHVPHISKNLLSAQRLMADNHVFIELYPHIFFIKDIATKKILLLGRSKGGLYPIPINSSRSLYQVSRSIKCQGLSVSMASTS